MMKLRMTGAEYLENNKTKFAVWAPFKNKVQVIIKDRDQPIDLKKDDAGYWEGIISNVGPGKYYKFILDSDSELPDPASRSQPEGVHSWSRVVEKNSFSWNEGSWKGIPLSKMVIYELHVGTFTREGTFTAVAGKLDHLLELGVNTIEIMPVSQFPGSRNWGYDGVYPYAAQNSYGGAAALKEMINSCHKKGIAVILDAVYNHMGPEGNYLSQFGPYFTEKYQTPWGAALNFDDKHSDEVKNFFLQNVLMWLEEFRFDGLRLDAIHEIIDRGAKHFLKEMSQRVDELEEKTGRNYVLIAESDLNDIKIINSYEKGGYGLEGQWVDDFHHSLHTLLTGEDQGYYKDYGKMEHLEKAFKQGFVYDGIYSRFRKRTVGNSPAELPKHKLIVSIQNHDQVGNRMLGDRLSELVSFEKIKLAAGIMLTSPFVPMLFMGEEFAEDKPFQYFVSHGDKDLVKAVQEGRKREFQYFIKDEGDFPDPQGEETFRNSTLNWDFREDERKNTVFEYYKFLLKERAAGTFEPFRNKKVKTTSNEEKKYITVLADEEQGLFAAFNFNDDDTKLTLPSGQWKLITGSGDNRWGGKAELPHEITGEEDLTIPENSIVIYRRNK